MKDFAKQILKSLTENKELAGSLNKESFMRGFTKLYRGRNPQYGEPMTPTVNNTLFGAEEPWIAREFGSDIRKFFVKPKNTYHGATRSDIAEEILGVAKANAINEEVVLERLGIDTFKKNFNPYDEFDKIALPKLKDAGYDSWRLSEQAFDNAEWMIMDPKQALHKKDVEQIWGKYQKTLRQSGVGKARTGEE